MAWPAARLEVEWEVKLGSKVSTVSTSSGGRKKPTASQGAKVGVKFVG